jgi:Na+-transporting NADH:ubiquinone oxidoreductase subunit NqrA
MGIKMGKYDHMSGELDVKVICVTTTFKNNPKIGYSYLTEGKVYTAIRYEEDSIIIIDDDGDRASFTSYNLKKLSEIRQDKLNKLLEYERD